VDDFAYLFRDSTAAYLRGVGDARFSRYERYYQQRREALADKFDLESANEEYVPPTPNRLASLVRVLDSRATSRILVGFLFAGLGASFLRTLGPHQPGGVGIAIVVAFVGMRMAYRRRRR
jgi:hypothetical protein